MLKTIIIPDIHNDYKIAEKMKLMLIVGSVKSMVDLSVKIRLLLNRPA
jgi:hypothetical protein